ncbi:hypothetical protein ACET6Y_17885, partial [Aeromonas veronii]
SGAVAQPTTSEMSRIQAACQGIRRVPSGGIGECRTSKLNSRSPLLSSTEQRYCPSCQRETNHVVVLVDKSFGKQPTPEQKRTAFIKDFITGWAAGPFLANMDRFERHTICENCGNKVIDE